MALTLKYVNASVSETYCHILWQICFACLHTADSFVYANLMKLHNEEN